MTRDRAPTPSTPSPAPRPYIPSETYRAMLVRDGERRFQEWHQSFLAYQKAFLQDLERRRRA